MQIAAVEADLRLLLINHRNVYQARHCAWSDSMTNFIYELDTYANLLNAIHRHLGGHPDAKRLTSYALYRWFNRMVSEACEWMFCQHPGVTPHPNPKHKTIDIYVNDVGFDVKATVIPSAFSLQYAAANPQAALNWYYKHQSGGLRHAINNRLIVAKQGFWYHKCELEKLSLQIGKFMLNWNMEIQKSTKYPGLESGIILVA